jgi:hypothetical protein
MLTFVLVFIPKKELRKIFWFSVLWGVGLDLIVILLSRIFNLYHYVNFDPFNFYGSPIFVNLSWAPAVMLFIHFLPARNEKYVLPLYLSIYAMLGTFIGVFLTKAGLLVEVHWNELLRFPLVYACFYACHKHYQYLKKKDSDTI